MPVSANGYSANDRTVIGSYLIPRTQQRVAIRKGDVSVILLDLLGWIHIAVEPLDVGIFDDWGYAERTIRGSTTTLSNHASGTAVDANATQHPLGAAGTWSAEEKRLINARLALYEGCVRWGENYTGRRDAMHFEIDKGAADCKRVADKIRAGLLGDPTLEDDVSWTDPVPDYYTASPSDRLPAGEALAWGVAHAANARDAARQAVTQVSALGAKVDALAARLASGPAAGPAQLTDADVARIAAAVVALLGKKALS